MGRKTFESLNGLLKNRHHVVLSSSNCFPSEVDVYDNLESLLKDYDNKDEEIFIIGGESIYKEFIDTSDKLYLTEIDSECKDATTYFPYFDKSKFDKEILKENSDDGINYKHVLYKRK